MLKKTNKCQINAKMGGKIFLIFFIFEQKIISHNQKEKIINDQNITQWVRGVQMEKRGASSKLTQAQPKPALSSTFSNIQTEKCAFPSPSTIS